MSTPPVPTGAPELLGSLGLLVDGPVLFGRPVRSSAPGIYLVALGAPLAQAPIDHAALRAWLERLPDLRMDGRRPTPVELAARLASFWLPDQTVLFIGSTAKSIGGRAAAYAHTALGDRRPHAQGQWLKTLRNLDELRVWWAECDAVEEYEDALFDAFAAGVGAGAREKLPQPPIVLPFANQSRSTGERRVHGLTGTLVPEDAAPPPAHVTIVPPEEAERPPEPIRARRAGGYAPVGTTASRVTTERPRGGRTASRSPSRAATPSARTGIAGRAVGGGRRPAPPPPPRAEPTYLSAAGLAGLQQELDQLIAVRRPEVILRVKTARELGDLRENADYEAARKEQSFVEGRIQALEALLKNAVVIDESQSNHQVSMGSTVMVDSVHGEETFVIVGSAEADPRSGRISYTSPIGAALLGRAVGDAVDVRTPAGSMVFRILEVR